jgi:hypothetical protein
MQENKKKYLEGRCYVEVGSVKPSEMKIFFEMINAHESALFGFDNETIQMGYGVNEYLNIKIQTNDYFKSKEYRKITRDELLEAINVKDSQDKKYYYLMAENGSKPIFKHESYESALNEAERLIKTKQNIGFIEILECRTIVAKEIKLNIKTLI